MALVESVENALTSAEEQLATSAALSSKRKKKPILIITVDIGKGKSGDITVYTGDSNQDLAVNFCQEHELSETLVSAIAKHIQQNVDALNKGKLKRAKEAAKAKEEREAAALSKSDTLTSSSVPSSSTAASATAASATTSSTSTASTTSTSKHESMPPPAPSAPPPPPSALPSSASQSSSSAVRHGASKKKKKKRTKQKVATSSSFQENSKVAALLGRSPPQEFVSKSEVERRRKATLRKQKEKEERELRRKKRLEKKRKLREEQKNKNIFNNTTATTFSTGSTTTTSSHVINKTRLKKKSKKKNTMKKQKDVYARLYNHGMEHWEKVDMTTANRMKEKQINAETFTFKPEIHAAPNSMETGSSGGADIYSRLYRDGILELREKEAETLKREMEKKKLALDECTFRPAINQRSLELIQRKRDAENNVGRSSSSSSNSSMHGMLSAGNVRSAGRKSSAGGKSAMAGGKSATAARGGEDIFERVYDPPRFTDKIILLAKQQEEKEMEECTFQPTISEKSRKIVNRKRRALDGKRGRDTNSSSSSTKSALFKRGPTEYHTSTHISSRERKFEELYDDAQRRREKQDEYYAWEAGQYTFKPDIGVNKIREHPDLGSRKKFYERMHKSGKDKEYKLKKKRIAADTVDGETGQKLFHPKVGRAPNFVRNAHGLPVHDFLFASRHEYNDKKRLLEAEERRRLNNNFNKSHVTDVSTRLINTARRRRSAEIFISLLPKRSKSQSQNSTTTSSSTTTTTTERLNEELNTSTARYFNLPDIIDEHLKNVVTSMLQRLNGASITFDEFSTLLDRELEDTGSGPIMSILVNNKGRTTAFETTKKEMNQKDNKNLTFKPKINRNSIEMANKLGRGDTATMPIYELLHKHQRRYRTNLEIQQARQIELEMKECTFQPKKISNNTNYNGSMYSRLPGAYVSPTKSSKSQRRNKAPSSETSYQPPDVWTPDGGDSGGGGLTSSGGSYGSSGRSGRSRGPERVFGRRATNSGRDQFLGLESLVSSHQKKQQLEMEKKKKEEEVVQQQGSVHKLKTPTRSPAKSSEKEVKVVVAAATAVAEVAVATATIMAAASSPAVVTSPSSTLTPEASSTLKTDSGSGSGKKIMKGGNGGKKDNTNNNKKKKKKSKKSSEKKDLKHKRSATAMHPPPEDLTSVPEVEKVTNDDMNDIDRVLAELRSVTTEDDKVGYKTEQ